MFTKNLVFLILFLALFSINNGIFASQNTLQNEEIIKERSLTTEEGTNDVMTFKSGHLGASFFLSLLIDIVFVFILVRFIYYPIYDKKDFFFTFFLFNIIIFIIIYLFNRIELSTGAAFGIFAVFSLLRYRTEDISAKDMTYLFIVIALGL